VLVIVRQVEMMIILNITLHLSQDTNLKLLGF